MKKVLSIFLSICMLVGCFVAMIPSANAAVSNPERFPTAYRESLIYSEDFEGDTVVASTNSDTLFSALGWGGQVGGAIKIVQDEGSENHRLEISGATESMIVCKDNALRGGGYIVEYTAIMTGFVSSDGMGMGFRSTFDGGNSPKTAGWNFLVKERGNFDFHFHTPGVANGNHHSEEDIAKGAPTINGVERPGGSIYGQEIRFRLVIDPVNGLSAYTIDLETGEPTIVAGMNADYVSSWAASANTLNDEMILRTIGDTKHQIDDIEIYTLDTKSYSVPDMLGYQTSQHQDGTYDIRFLAKMAKKTEAHRLGYKVEYRYVDTETDRVYRGGAEYSCNYVYSSVSIDNGQGTLSFADFKVLALHINGIPSEHDILFTVTPFVTYWSDLGSMDVYDWGLPTAYIVKATQ